MKRVFTLTLAIGLGLASGSAFAEEKKVSCGDVDAAMMEAGGAKSADEIAAKLHTTPAHVRECLDKQAAEQRPADNPPPAEGK
jgi:hypothetical protein